MNSIKEKKKKIYQLLKETPPDGEAFAGAIIVKSLTIFPSSDFFFITALS